MRRGGTLSISGVYGGAATPLPMFDLFDCGLQIRMGQAHVKRWIDDLMLLVAADDEPAGRRGPHHAQASARAGSPGFEMFQKKADRAIKVIFQD